MDDGPRRECAMSSKESCSHFSGCEYFQSPLVTIDLYAMTVFKLGSTWQLDFYQHQCLKSADFISFACYTLLVAPRNMNEINMMATSIRRLEPLLTVHIEASINIRHTDWQSESRVHKMCIE